MKEGLIAWLRHLRHIQGLEGAFDTAEQLAHPGAEIQRTRRGLRNLWKGLEELNDLLFSSNRANRRSRPS